MQSVSCDNKLMSSRVFNHKWPEHNNSANDNRLSKNNGASNNPHETKITVYSWKNLQFFYSMHKISWNSSEIVNYFTDVK